MKRTLPVTALMLALVAATAATADPLTQRQISRGVVHPIRSTPRPLVQHVIFGTIVYRSGATVIVRTRSGRLQRIDASAAIAGGTYSAPLFVGKLVAVGGTFDTSNVLRAQNISRLTRLDRTLGPDR